MGLSATIEGGERPRILERYLGPIIYRLNLQEALERGILPRFEWRIHPVTLAVEEYGEFEKLSRTMRNLFYKVSRDEKTIKELSGGEMRHLDNFHDFIGLCEKARYRNFLLPDDWKKLLTNVHQRRWIMHRSTPKLESAMKLAMSYGVEKKCVLFTMDIKSCERIARDLESSGIDVFVVHSQLKPQSMANRHILQFRDARSGVLIAPRMLDEGIDIPDAEIGINAASSKTRLQLVQRIGRILRKKKGKRPIFHHLVAIPSGDSYLLEEDGLFFLDDLSWVQETALGIGVEAHISPLDEELDILSVRRTAEEAFAKSIAEREEAFISRCGTIKTENIVSRIPKQARKKLIELLDGLKRDYIISDGVWARMIRIAHEESLNAPMTLPGFWRILVIGGRNPQSIAEVLRRCSKDNS
ncbi:MAG: DEAD/DEAH box helicase [Thermoplasmata archaeon]